MPEIGEIKSGRALGHKYWNKCTWHACIDCGKERWVRIIKGNPHQIRCKTCTLRQTQLRNRGEGNGRWRGGKRKTSRGYLQICISADDFFYPMTTQQGYILEHRLVLAKALGRCLHPWEIVHHKGAKYPKGSKEDKQDNRYPENLQLVSDLGHNQITILENRIKRLEARLILLEAENVLLRTENSGLLSGQ